MGVLKLSAPANRSIASAPSLAVERDDRGLIEQQMAATAAIEGRGGRGLSEEIAVASLHDWHLRIATLEVG